MPCVRLNQQPHAVFIKLASLRLFTVAPVLYRGSTALTLTAYLTKNVYLIWVAGDELRG